MLSHSVEVRPERLISAAVVGNDIVMGVSGCDHSALWYSAL
jgi:molybdopterin biosynthesis enzyme